MPGYYVHLATVNPQIKENRSFIYGVEMPDLLKTYFKIYGIDGTREKYDAIRIDKMPDFSVFKRRVQSPERKNCRDGMHYGLSSNPDIHFFWSRLTEEEKKNPFYLGYLWHLLTDLLMYSYLDIERKFDEFTQAYKKDESLIELQKQECKKLHSDWDKINSKICKKYPDVILPPEILELGIVKFLNGNHLTYVNWESVQLLIDYMRTFNPLKEDVNQIIEEFDRILMQTKSKELKKTISKKLVLYPRKY